MNPPFRPQSALPRAPGRAQQYVLARSGTVTLMPSSRYFRNFGVKVLLAAPTSFTA
jgi:hypothetical protein